MNRSGVSKYREIRVSIHPGVHYVAVSVVARVHTAGRNRDNLVHVGRFDSPLDGATLEELLALAAISLEHTVNECQ